MISPECLDAGSVDLAADAVCGNTRIAVTIEEPRRERHRRENLGKPSIARTVLLRPIDSHNGQFEEVSFAAREQLRGANPIESCPSVLQGQTSKAFIVADEIKTHSELERNSECGQQSRVLGVELWPHVSRFSRHVNGKCDFCHGWRSAFPEKSPSSICTR